jgi:uncharacterized membrane protein
MIFREGVETVLMLSAAAMNTSGILEIFGAGLGLGLAVLFGVSFVRGTIRINLRSFFKMTTVILMVVVFQLLVTGLHELSEGGILPSSSEEMALVGPIVRNDIFFFVAILALAAAMMLWEWRERRAPIAVVELEGAALRKAKWSARRERLWMVGSCVASCLFILMITAEFIYAKSATALSDATPLTVTGDFAKIPLATVSDGTLHRFSVESDGVTVRIIVIQRPDKSVVAAFDACEICGAKGFYQKGGTVVCKNCASAIVNSSIGLKGGCNPIPLPSEIQGDQLVIPAGGIFKGARIFRAG